MKKTILAVALVSLLVSCGKRVLLDETHSLDKNVWMWSEPEVFDFEVQDVDNPYVIVMSMSYDTDLVTSSSVPLKIEFFTDSNARHTLFPSLTLVDRDGSRRGTKIDRFCTVTDTLDRCRLFNEAGVYTYKVKQLTGKYEMNGVSALGMKVERL